MLKWAVYFVSETVRVLKGTSPSSSQRQGMKLKRQRKEKKKKMLTPENWKDGKDGHRQRNRCKQTRGWTSAESTLGENDRVESASLCAPVSRQPLRPGGHTVAPSVTSCPRSGDQRPQKVGPSVEPVTSLGYRI